MQALPSLQVVPTGRDFLPQAPLPGLQVASLHASAGHCFTPPALHAPLPSHASPTVQALLSEHVVPLVSGCLPQVPLPMHTPRLQASPAHVFCLPPLHAPAPSHTSSSVQPSLSSQAVPPIFGVLPHDPVAASHTPTLHASPAHDFGWLPTHTPLPSQLSTVVHALPSVQPDPAKTVVLQAPVKMSHDSLVHTLSSSQSFALPPQAPFAVQLSALVQGFSSSHDAPVSGVPTQPPVVTSQASDVHGFLSSHAFFLPLHTPSAQASLVVQVLPSSQPRVFWLLMQAPVAVAQLSLVHVLPSSQVLMVPLQVPSSPHASLVVQRFLSSHLAPVVGGVTHLPLLASHLSAVHGLPSSHTTTLPLHCPAAQVSVAVQASPSLHWMPLVLL